VIGVIVAIAGIIDRGERHASRRRVQRHLAARRWGCRAPALQVEPATADVGEAGELALRGGWRQQGRATGSGRRAGRAQRENSAGYGAEHPKP
jgi:hypothetical protein